MDLYLMQHGEAMAEDVDPTRPLTEEGRAAVSRVAGRARSAGVRVDECFHSGNLRAEQTALLLMDEVGAGGVVEARPGLGPKDLVLPAAQWLWELTDVGSAAVVGHLPFLDRLASLLVVGDEENRLLAFHNAGLVRLQPDETGGYVVDWVLTPGLAG